MRAATTWSVAVAIAAGVCSVESPASAEITEWSDPGQSAWQGLGYQVGTDVVLTDDGGHATLSRVLSGVGLANAQSITVSKFDSAGTMQWTLAVPQSHDSYAARIKQGIGPDNDLYVLFNHDGVVPVAMRVDVLNGSILWMTQPVPSTMQAGALGHNDIGAPWFDFVFTQGGQSIAVVGAEGLQPNPPAVHYMPNLTEIDRTSGTILSRHTYAVINSPWYPQLQQPFAMLPFRIVEHVGQQGRLSYIVVANILQLDTTVPSGLRGSGVAMLYVNPATLEWEGMGGNQAAQRAYFLSTFSGGIERPPHAFDARVDSNGDLVMAGYVDDGPFGGTDLVVLRQKVMSTPQIFTLGGVHEALIVGTADDDTAMSVVEDPAGGYLVAGTQGYDGSNYLPRYGEATLLRLDGNLQLDWSRTMDQYPMSALRDLESVGGGTFRLMGEGADTNGTRFILDAVLPIVPNGSYCGMVPNAVQSTDPFVGHSKFDRPPIVPLGTQPLGWAYPSFAVALTDVVSCTSCTVQAGFTYAPASGNVPVDTFTNTSSPLGQISYAWNVQYLQNSTLVSVVPTPANATPTHWTVAPPGNLVSAELTVTEMLNPLCHDTITFP